MLNHIAQTAYLLITLTIVTTGGLATAETEKSTNSCNQISTSLQTENYLALSPNGDPSQCSDYYEKCDEYHCYECTVCTHGGPYCWEISENKKSPQTTDVFVANN